jgi:hypothetical protein
MQQSLFHSIHSIDSTGRAIQQHISDVITIHRLVNEGCTQIRIIIASKRYRLIAYRIYDMLFEDRVVMHFLRERMSDF